MHKSVHFLSPAEIDYPATSFIQAVDPSAVIDPNEGPDPQLRVPLVNLSILTVAVLLYALPASPDPQGLAATLVTTGDLTQEFPITDRLTLAFDATIELALGLALVFRPGQGLAVINNVLDGGSPSPILTGRALLKLIYGMPDGSEPTRLLSIPGGSYLEVNRIQAMVGAGIVAAGVFDALLEIGLEGGVFSLNASEADGFLSTILPGDGITVNFDIAVGWIRSQGVYFKGSSSLEVRLPTHIELGPIKIENLYLAAGFDGPHIPLEVSTALATTLGPLAASVDRLGVKLNFGFPGNGGNLGPVNLDFQFKPPTGMGLSLDAGVFKGGGFLEFDVENESYAGILQLEFAEIVAVTAVGLLTTRLPGGVPGFSLLIIISAEFTPIQLGFGFTLNGVGGLLGLNRTMNIDRLREGVRGETLGSIMFPVDPIANANRIISDIREVFPPQADRFVFGPFVRIGWGVPTLITIDLGLLIEIPSPVRIAIIGVLKMILPDEDARILALQVNFLGVIDFDKQELSFDASLYNSRLLTMTLSGDMAVRLNWGDNPNFILSVGGFHPSYTPPAGLTTMQRLTLRLLPTDNPRLTLETYFAVTSNTVQFGARLELYAEAGPFNVYGFLGFDVLFQFSPFKFIAEISAGIAVRAGSSTIMSIHLRLTLSGPTPWHAHGTGEISLLFFSVDVDIDITWGDEANTTLPDVEVMPLLLEALNKTGNWQATVPSKLNLLVSTRDLSAITDVVLVHPFGSLVISQKIVPLDLTINKFGSAKPAGTNKFSITKVQTGTGSTIATLTTSDARDQFAPAQFQDMKDEDKLKSASFQQLKSGIQTGTSRQLKFSKVTTRDVKYEETIIDKDGLRIVWRLIALDFLHFSAFVNGSAASKSVLAQKEVVSPLSSPPVSMAVEEAHAVVNADDLSVVTMYASHAEAFSAMSEMIAAQPELANTVQVVPAYEVSQ
jgi:hypothetical protein